MRIRTFLFIAALGAPATAAADNPPKAPAKAPAKVPDKAPNGDARAKLSEIDRDILAHAHRVNALEIELGHAIQRKQGSDAVRQFAEQLVRDHSASDQRLLQLAKAHGFDEIPDGQPDTEARRKQLQSTKEQADKLEAMQGGPALDRAFLAMMVEAHEQEIKKTNAEIARTKSPELKQLLEQRRAMLQRHAEAARKLQKEVAAPPPKGNGDGQVPKAPPKP